MDDDFIDSDDKVTGQGQHEQEGRWDSKETLSKASFPLWLKDYLKLKRQKIDQEWQKI